MTEPATLTQGPGESQRDFWRRVWMAQSATLRDLAVDTLRHDSAFLRGLPAIRQAIHRAPNLWWEPHLTQFGLAVQKTLRESVCPDKVIASGTWDMLWVPAVEAAVREEHYVT